MKTKSIFDQNGMKEDDQHHLIEERGRSNSAKELTRREKEILRLICAEYNTEEIAAHLFVSTRTVDGHRINLLAKTGSKNVAGLVLYAIRHRIYIPVP